MPKLGTKIAEANEPTEGKDYTITKTEITTTDIQSWNACRVIMNEVNKKGEVLTEEKSGEQVPIEAVTMLWMREQAGARSKIGSFLSAFQDFFEGTEFEGNHDNTDNWEGHIVRFTKWSERNRKIKVLS